MPLLKSCFRQTVPLWPARRTEYSTCQNVLYFYAKNLSEKNIAARYAQATTTKAASGQGGCPKGFFGCGRATCPGVWRMGQGQSVSRHFAWIYTEIMHLG